MRPVRRPRESGDLSEFTEISAQKSHLQVLTSYNSQMKMDRGLHLLRRFAGVTFVRNFVIRSQKCLLEKL